MMKTETPRLTLLIVDDLHPVFIEKMQEAGFYCDYQPTIDREQARLLLKKYDALIIRSKFKVDQDIINSAPGLKLIGRVGAGIDNIDEDYARGKGVYLVSAPEGNCDAVGEHMVGMLLGLLNNLYKGNTEIRKGLWSRESNRGTELGDKTVGLIGYGNNGQAMARKLSGFGVKVLAYDKYRANYSDAYAQEASMEQLYTQADILSMHIPLTTETNQLVNAEFLSNFQKPIYFLNGSRGEIAAMDSIVTGLRNKTILGAGFDVLPIEKFPALSEAEWFHQLLAFDNVLFTPHVAGWSVQSYYKLSLILAEKIIQYQAEQVG